MTAVLAPSRACHSFSDTSPAMHTCAPLSRYLGNSPSARFPNRAHCTQVVFSFCPYPVFTATGKEQMAVPLWAYLTSLSRPRWPVKRKTFMLGPQVVFMPSSLDGLAVKNV